MNVISLKAATRASTAETPIVSLKGRGKAERTLAYTRIAPLAFVESMSRAESLANLQVALGLNRKDYKPSEVEIVAAQNEWMIGRVADRLAKAEFPSDCTESADRLEHARVIVLSLGQPIEDGKAPRKLAPGKTGRRTVAQHKAVRAAESAWSLVKADLGLSEAKGLTPKAKGGKRKPRVAGESGSAPTPPTGGDLVKPPVPLTCAEAHNHLITQMAALLAYCNKHAKIIETGFSVPIIACKKALNVAANDYALRMAKVDAEAAEHEPDAPMPKASNASRSRKRSK